MRARNPNNIFRISTSSSLIAPWTWGPNTFSSRASSKCSSSSFADAMAIFDRNARWLLGLTVGPSASTTLVGIELIERSSCDLRPGARTADAAERGNWCRRTLSAFGALAERRVLSRIVHEAECVRRHADAHHPIIAAAINPLPPPGLASLRCGLTSFVSRVLTSSSCLGPM
jgi:hypothetical protein